MVKFSALLLAGIITFCSSNQPPIYREDTKQELPDKADVSQTTIATDSAILYDTYLEQYKNAATDGSEIVINAKDYTDVANMPDIAKTDAGILTQEVGEITYKFNAPTEGLYNLAVKYYPAPGKGSAIERDIILNGETPYAEANSILFYRTWVDANQDYKKQKGNQTFPSQIENPGWKETVVHDSSGFYIEPLRFYLKKGENTLTLRSSKEAMEIETLSFRPVEKLKSYTEYIDTHKAEGIKEIENFNLTVQGEDAVGKSSPSFFPLNDRTSVKTQPYHYTNIVLNTIGGKSWNTSGDWISWDVDVPEDGLYRVAMRYKQGEVRGSFCTRSLKVNGEIPFEQARDLRFSHKTSFQMNDLKDNDGNNLLIYLKKGTNNISLEVSLGVFSQIIKEIEQSTKILNDTYRDIVVITGSTPDQYRDYLLLQRIPNLLETFQTQADRIGAVLTEMQDIMGGNSEKTAVISKTLLQLEDLIANPESIAKKLVSLKDNITAMGKWSFDIKNQPLVIDYLSILGKNEKLPKAEGNFFQGIGHEFMAFVGSFTNNFNVYSDDVKTQSKPIEVWVTTGRDQLEVIKRLVNETFETQSGIAVDMKLVSADVLLPATFTGRGPDVAIQIGSTLPVNFATREAAYDLTKFPDFPEVAKNFVPGAIDTFKFDGGYYALPDQMSFPVMFYRKDILSKLNIPVPNTWDDVFESIPYLQKNNMEIYLDTATPLTLGSAASVGNSQAINSIFLSMFYQNGGTLYKNGGETCDIDSTIGTNIFKSWTEFYTKHGFPTEVDFVTRFRIGEVPIGVVDFTTYSKLSVSAPEIRGAWEMALAPGTLQPDGSINRDMPCVTSAALIIKAAVEERSTEQEAWEFLKWWTSADTQTKYAREMEAILGSSGRYPVANIESFEAAPWPAPAMKVLKEGLKSVREVEQVPGGYITGRYLQNAFLEVINEDANPSDVIYEYTKLINDELVKKRAEMKTSKAKE